MTDHQPTKLTHSASSCRKRNNSQPPPPAHACTDGRGTGTGGGGNSGDPRYFDNQGGTATRTRQEWVLEAIALLCGEPVPADVAAADDEGESLQFWVCDHVPPWMTGYGAVEAAEHIVATSIENASLRPTGAGGDR
jgi:hypothetical protein